MASTSLVSTDIEIHSTKRGIRDVKFMTLHRWTLFFVAADKSFLSSKSELFDKQSGWDGVLLKTKEFALSLL